jgi:non-specific serine/threonine protein kinase
MHRDSKSSFGTELHFDKHETGISYTLFFKGRRHYFYPSTAITLLLDEPGWLIAHKMYTVKNINSKKLRLLTKSSKIPSKLVPDYFEKFIKDIAKKVDISATGFEVITQTAVRSATYNWCMIF